MIIYICIATFFSTLLGGLVAIKFRRKLYLILGFSAGAVIGAAFFDLLPTALELSSKAYGLRFITSMAGLGFMGYFLLDRALIFISKFKKDIPKTQGIRGSVIAACLTLHSLLDGVAIGLAFQVSPAIGSIVAVAVLVHDFADGINTANVILKENGNRSSAIKWLILNAIAPVFGAWSTFYYQLPQSMLGAILAVVSGFFIYIGASDFLPQSQERRPGLVTILMVMLGMAIIFTAIRFANI